MTRVRASWSCEGGRFGVLVHGGAGTLDPDEIDPSAGCRTAVERALSVLAAGGSALDAVEAAVVTLEDDPRYNAGVGASLTETGEVELDASIMDGRDLRAGAVCALTHHRNAVRVARAALEDGRHVFYAGEGARAVARRAGLSEVDPTSLVTARARERLARFLDGGNTVGAVARDAGANVAAATSTGGITGKRSGRVGDSPVIGAGTYADNERGAGSATGPGEAILRVALTFRATAELGGARSPAFVAGGALDALFDRVGGCAGLVLVDASGRLGLARSTDGMPWAAGWDGGHADGF
jgi:beta-aspartyl-peptidase (threonine type)